MISKEEFIREFYTGDREKLIAKIKWDSGWCHRTDVSLEEEVRLHVVGGYEAELAVQRFLEKRKQLTGLDYQFDGLNQWHFEIGDEQQRKSQKQLNKSDVLVQAKTGEMVHVEIKHLLKDCLTDPDCSKLCNDSGVYRVQRPHEDTEMFFLVDKEIEKLYVCTLEMDVIQVIDLKEFRDDLGKV